MYRPKFYFIYVDCWIWFTSLQVLRNITYLTWDDRILINLIGKIYFPTLYWPASNGNQFSLTYISAMLIVGIVGLTLHCYTTDTTTFLSEWIWIWLPWFIKRIVLGHKIFGFRKTYRKESYFIYRNKQEFAHFMWFWHVLVNILFMVDSVVNRINTVV